jgi:hypothetical protein
MIDFLLLLIVIRPWQQYIAGQVAKSIIAIFNIISNNPRKVLPGLICCLGTATRYYSLIYNNRQTLLK